MSQHPNARLTPKERKTLVSRIGSGAGVVDGQLHELRLGVLGQELVEHVRRRMERDAETLDEAPLPHPFACSNRCVAGMMPSSSATPS